MPKAVASQETKREELETVPGGYVVLRKMNYGEVLHRRDIAAKMGSAGDEVEVKLQFLAVQQYELNKCVVEHNLEKDDNGTLFNFREATDVMLLDPVVGQEIEKLIDEMNKLPGEETARFPRPSDDGGSAGQAGSV